MTYIKNGIEYTEVKVKPENLKYHTGKCPSCGKWNLYGIKNNFGETCFNCGLNRVNENYIPLEGHNGSSLMIYVGKCPKCKVNFIEGNANDWGEKCSSCNTSFINNSKIDKVSNSNGRVNNSNNNTNNNSYPKNTTDNEISNRSIWITTGLFLWIIYAIITQIPIFVTLIIPLIIAIIVGTIAFVKHFPEEANSFAKTKKYSNYKRKTTTKYYRSKNNYKKPQYKKNTKRYTRGDLDNDGDSHDFFGVNYTHNTSGLTKAELNEKSGRRNGR